MLDFWRMLTPSLRDHAAFGWNRSTEGDLIDLDDLERAVTVMRGRSTLRAGPILEEQPCFVVTF